MKHTSKPKNTATDLQFIKNFLTDSLREINPMNNIRMIKRDGIRGDIMAGITVAIIALPLALAFGVGSGLGPMAGIWGAICGGIFGGLFGGSRLGVSGPTGPKMVQLAAYLAIFTTATGDPDIIAAFTIIFLSGVILVVLSLLRVGRFIYYTPYSVVAGFMCGIGVIVMLLEFDSFLGLPAPHSVSEAITSIPYAITHISYQALAVSVPTLAILFLWPYVIKQVPKLRIVPSPLVALVLGTSIANGFALNIEYIGDIPTGLPSLYMPDLSRFSDFIWPAFTLAGLAIFDSLLTCVVADQMTGDRHSSDRETFGQGIANMAAGLVGGLTTATATMRTVANVQSGGRSPLASITHGLVLLALVLGLGPLASTIPMAALAAILFKVGIDILDYRIIPVLHRLPLTDMLVFWTVLVVTVVEDLLVAMAVGMVLAFFRFVQEVSTAYEHKVEYASEDEDVMITDGADVSFSKKRIKILKPEGPLFFGSIDPLHQSYHQAKEHDVLVIDLKSVPLMDLSGAYAIEDLVEEARSNGVEVFISGASEKVSNVLERVKVVDKVGEKQFFRFTHDAVAQARSLGIAEPASLYL